MSETSFPREGRLLDMPLRRMPKEWFLALSISKDARDDLMAWWQEHQDFLASERETVASPDCPLICRPYYGAESIGIKR